MMTHGYQRFATGPNLHIVAGMTILLGFGFQTVSAQDETPVASSNVDLFAKPNLVAWCIVPFDANKRSPEERANMLKRLGLSRVAYDWRADDIPSFDEELNAYQRHGIRLQAFWTPVRTENPLKEEHWPIILDLLRRHDVKTELWVSLGDRMFIGLEQGERVEKAAAIIEQVAAAAENVGCKIGLYNHGGWFGEPKNQIAIIKHLQRDNVGIVYNFHHGHEHLTEFADLLHAMQPHLLSININGMNAGGPKILPLGEGERERRMLQQILQAGYQGPIGILDHRNELDAEQSLQQNLNGLEKIVQEIHAAKEPTP